MEGHYIQSLAGIKKNNDTTKETTMTKKNPLRIFTIKRAENSLKDKPIRIGNFFY